MKQTRYTPDPKQPYGFLDCHINGMEITDGNLRLTFNDFFYKKRGPKVRGDVVIESIEPLFCEVIIQG